MSEEDPSGEVHTDTGACDSQVTEAGRVAFQLHVLTWEARKRQMSWGSLASQGGGGGKSILYGLIWMGLEGGIL